MTRPNLCQSDISEQLSNMSLVESTKALDEVSPISSDGSACKRFRPRVSDTRPSHLFPAGVSFLDPLLYLRVSKVSQIPSKSLPVDSTTPLTLDEILAADRERTRILTDFRPEIVNRKKAKLPLPDTPRIPSSVYKYCKEHGVKFTTLSLKKSYRSLVFRRSEDPWSAFIEENNLEHYRLCHAVYFGTSSGGRVVCLVPHLKEGKVEPEFLSTVLGQSIVRVSLSTIQKDLNLPTFVVPPFSTSPVEATLIDSTLVDQVSTDCVFELGSTAIRIRPCELLKLAKKNDWKIIPNLNLPPQ